MEHVANFDPEAVQGFERDHMIGMDLEAMTAFNPEQVMNLEAGAKEGFGDKVPGFEDFSVDVRRELLDDSQLLLGGVGSFDDMAAAILNPDSMDDAELVDAGWDATAELLDQVEIEVVDLAEIPETVIAGDAALLALEFFAEAAIEQAPEPVALIAPESTATEILLNVETAEAEATAATAEEEAAAATAEAEAKAAEATAEEEAATLAAAAAEALGDDEAAAAAAAAAVKAAAAAAAAEAAAEAEAVAAAAAEAAAAAAEAQAAEAAAAAAEAAAAAA
jgi:hypothetical protein